MMRFRLLCVMVVGAAAMFGAGGRAIDAQSPTPITISSPTAEGCEQVPAYLEARQKVFEELLIDMESVFPAVATPILEHGDELVVAMFGMTPEQFIALAKAYDDAADKIEKIDAPPVADVYNDLQVQLYRLSADVFEEAASTGLNAAGDTFNDQLVAVGEAVGAAGQAATSVCPAFAEVIELDQTQAAL
ncbi:MAG: hypothetical protein KC438_12920 [Thermomicrobiales bacterium]|nr:hypothetical protein [Thermomicrobiales bacterium]MCO5222872.1 hypothetical protein [Thermomicrobiales bacterium]